MGVKWEEMAKGTTRRSHFKHEQTQPFENRKKQKLESNGNTSSDLKFTARKQKKIEYKPVLGSNFTDQKHTWFRLMSEE
jgi:hypothetical protein